MSNFPHLSSLSWREEKTRGPTSYLSLFSLSCMCQTRENASFSAISRFDISLFNISLLPNKAFMIFTRKSQQQQQQKSQNNNNQQYDFSPVWLRKRFDFHNRLSSDDHDGGSGGWGERHFDCWFSFGLFLLLQMNVSVTLEILWMKLPFSWWSIFWEKKLLERF